MVVKEIRDFPVLHALERFMDEEKLYDGYYSLYRRIDDMNFVMRSRIMHLLSEPRQSPLTE